MKRKKKTVNKLQHGRKNNNGIIQCDRNDHDYCIILLCARGANRNSRYTETLPNEL